MFWWRSLNRVCCRELATVFGHCCLFTNKINKYRVKFVQERLLTSWPNMSILFFFTARRYASAVYMLLLCVRLSVRPSVTSRHCIKTAKRKITQTAPYDIPGTLVLWHQISLINSNGVGQKRRFSTNILLYPRNGARQGHSYYGTLIGNCMPSIEWSYFQWPWVTPWRPQTTPFSAFYIAFNIFVMGGDRDFILGR